MTATDDAIEASAGQYQSRVTISWPGGGTNPIFDLVADVAVDRSVQDQPLSVTQIAGAAAAQATITLKSGNATYLASMLSPFSTNSWSTRTATNYGVGQVGVVIDEGILVSGSYVYTTLFTGTVTTFTLGDDGSAQLTCVDRSAPIQGTVNLPAAGGIQKSTSGDTRINPLAVVDLALRSGGYRLTPATATGAQLSVPGIGSGLPEVGGFLSAKSGTTNVASPWPTQLPTVDVAPSGSWSVVGALDPQVNFYFAGWFYAARPGGGPTTLLNLGGITITVSSTGVLTLTGPATSSAITAAGAWPAGAAAWHYVDYLVGVWSVDAASFVSTTYAIATESPTTTVSASVPVLGLQVGPIASYATLYGWTPNYTAALDTVPQRLSGIAKQTGAAWALVQQVAQALGDVAYWDGAGVFRYETRTTWTARRYVTPTYLKDDSRIISGSPSWGQDSLRRSVAANVVVPVTKRSTTTAPAWAAIDGYVVPANSTRSWDIALDYSIYNVKAFAGGFQTDANSSWVFAVAADSVEDPSATRIGGVTPTVTPTSSGFTLTIRNANAVDVSVWSPGNGGTIDAGPYLVVHGTTVTFPDPRLITVTTGSSSGDDLVLEDNPWRQDDDQTRVWVNAIASDVVVPQVIWGSIQVPADQRLTIGTVVSVRDTPYMDATHPVQIVGIAYELPAEGMHMMTLTVRSAYAPTGWILDVAGRSELDSTTLLIV